MKFDKLVERQILKAEVEGQLAGLKGEGEPLDLKPEADPAAASGFRIMAQAGALPREIQLRKDIEKKLAALAALADPSLRKAAISELATLQMQLAIEEEARRKFYRTAGRP